MPSELVAQMRAALEGVTPGPWSREDTQPGSTHVVNGERYIIALVPWLRPNVGNAHRDANFVALCSPENILAVLDALAAAEAELANRGDCNGAQVHVGAARWAEMLAAEAERDAVMAERMRCWRVAFDEAKRIRASSPFPAGSGERIAISIEQMAYGCEMVAKAIWDNAADPPPHKE